jgi:hypothetical protein
MIVESVTMPRCIIYYFDVSMDIDGARQKYGASRPKKLCFPPKKMVLPAYSIRLIVYSECDRIMLRIGEQLGTG